MIQLHVKNIIVHMQLNDVLLNTWNAYGEICSRLSGGSTQSEVIPSSGKKKKLGLFGKLTKKLTKSRSIDNDGSEMGSNGRVSVPGYNTKMDTV